MKTETEVTPRIRAIAWTAIMAGQTLRSWETSPVVPVSGGEKRQVALVIGKAWRAAQDSLKITNGKKAITAQVILERVTSDAHSLRNQSLQWLDSPEGTEVLAALPDKLRRTLAKDLPSAVMARQAERAKHDEKEAGERALLNFGHTAGHAIEKLWNYQTVTHGAAVGIGMVLAARAGEGAGLTEPGTADRIAALLQKYNLPVADTHSIDEIVDAMQADKKRTADGMKLVLLRKIGDSFIDPVDLPTLRTMFGGGACK